ncbi:MAG: hypothetical protein KC461_09350 [Dehalococcoidia bacterium]|nr:hypothetical protein [Dehalococcoidia bacterium]MCA9857581.1 hypothetical protein [Dehalococcoidia bacterium]MCB9483350.1 hypothetical protein [Dehalococcoidia bacterium]
MVNSSPLNLPPPPGSPGHSSQRYSHDKFGPPNGQFMTLPQDGSESKGEVDDWHGFNPLAWFDKQVTYINEIRYFNTFRAERVPGRDRVTKTPRRTGIFRDMRDGNMCWREEKVITDVKFEGAYMEVQRYEIWRINLTQESYYEFVTGLGGTMVDATIDIPAAAAGLTAERAATAAAAEGVAVSAGAARLAIASRALGTVGLTYLMFQVFTGAWVAYSGGTRNAAGDKISEGWEFIRHFYGDPIDDEPEEAWETVVAPHPCTDLDGDGDKIKIQTGDASQFLRTTRGKAVAGVAGVGILLGGLMGMRMFGGDDPEAPPPTPTVAAASVTATEVSAATPIDFGTPSPTPVNGVPAAFDSTPGPGQLLVFRLDGVDFFPKGLGTVAAHEPFCSYEHVHGPEITSVLPGPDGEYIKRTEHMGECGYGPPNFFLIDDPR